MRNSQNGVLTVSPKEGGRRPPPRSLPLISASNYVYGIFSVQNVIIFLMVTNCSGERSLSKHRIVEWKNKNH